MIDEKKLEFEFAGENYEVSTGKFAKQTSGAVTIRCRDTVLLVTVTAGSEPKADLDYFPLMVDFEEKLYSVGRIPGSYNRREGKASDKAVLVSRLIDRPIRPLFADGFRHDVQVNVQTWSVDQSAQPDVIAMLGVGFALSIAGLPFNGPIGAVRVSLDENGEFIINPSEEAMLNSDLDIVVAGTKDSVMMVEAGANFVEDSKVVDAIDFALQNIKKQVEQIEKFASMVEIETVEFEPPLPNDQLADIVAKNAHEDLVASMKNATKKSRKELVAKAKEKVQAAIEALGEESELAAYLAENKFAFDEAMKKYEKKLLRAQISDTGVRADGRNNRQVRPLHVEINNLPVVHGDGLFCRGDTQVMSILSLGTEKMGRMLDGIDSESEKFYMHNYNFPAWSVGEVRPNRGPGRREIGHGALAERAIIPALPAREDFPYAMRVVSEVMESSGSTSMASTCASSLALMAGGVPMKCQVAGVAMGLIQESTDKFTVLTDIHELEDFLGDMDFKVAGNNEGISALQMDIKIQGISMDTIRQAIEQAKEGRLHILAAMNEVIAAPSNDLKPSAPRIEMMKIPQDKIGAVIGPGGKNIKWITEQTGVEININDDGAVNIYCNDQESASEAKRYVSAIANGVQAGEVWDAKVVKVLDGVGAICELFGGSSGLVHISQISTKKVEKVEDYVKVGDEVKVKVQGTDFKGRISLSMKALEEESSEAEATAA